MLVVAELQLDRLEELMGRLQMGPAELARESGLTYNFIYRLRKGDRADLSASNLAAIADALGTNTEYLLGRIDDPQPIDALSDGEVMAYFEATNPELAAMYKMILELPPSLRTEAMERVGADLAMFHRLADLEEQAREREENGEEKL